MNNKKYKHLFELDMLKAYYKLDHIEQIRLHDNYVVPRFKDCSFLNYMKEKNYFTDIDKNDSLEDIIKRYETADFSNCEIKNKIEFEYDLLKIYQRYVEETKSHPLEYAGDVGVIFVHDNFLGLSPFLYEMLRNGYFQNGDMEVERQEQSKIPVDEIRPNPYQPRKVFNDEALKELSSSIKQHGVFTPILVKKSIQGYDLIAGERRLRASKLAGLKDIPAIIVDFDDQEMMEIALLENIQREDLNVIEEAKAYEKLIQRLGYTQEQLAHRVGKSREHITNLLRLLKLPEDVQEYVVSKQLSMGHVRALLGLKTEASMRKVAKQAIDQGLSVRKVEQIVKDTNNKKTIEKPKEDIYVKAAKEKLQEFFQTSVSISKNAISIHYENKEDLNRILELLNLVEEE